MSARSLLIVVPRTRLDLYKPLKRSFDDHEKVEVVLDRRFRDRRGQSTAHDPDRRRGDRRRRSHLDADLKAGRWVTVPVAPSRLDFADPDTRAILFLYCGEHVVGCSNCLMTYRLRWLPRTDAGAYSCPRCTADMTPAVVAHTQTCWCWATPGTARPPAKIAREDPPVAAASD
jgi:hypothetical protein